MHIAVDVLINVYLKSLVFSQMLVNTLQHVHGELVHVMHRTYLHRLKYTPGHHTDYVVIFPVLPWWDTYIMDYFTRVRLLL